MLRRARGQLKGLLAIAGIVGLAACGRRADAGPTAPPLSAPATSPAVAPVHARVAASGPGAAPVTDAASTTAPLAVHVVGIRREGGDSIRVELTLANLAAAGTWRAGSPESAAVQAAVAALEDASVLSADGRRRLFALRGSTGQRVGSPMTVPLPGHPHTFWTLFPAADGPVSLLLPGFAPLAGLPVAAPPAGRPEP